MSKTGTNFLRSVGIAIFGKRWQRPLATCLDVDERQIRRWLEAEQLDRNHDVFSKLIALLEANEATMMKERQALVRWLARV